MTERYLPDVIQQMLPLIPETEVDLIGELKYIYNTAIYTAPEMMYEQWYYGSVALRTYFPHDLKDLNEWQIKVVEVWNPTLNV